MGFINITASTARSMFMKNKTITLCPNKLRPGAPWHPESQVSGIGSYRESYHKKDQDVWKTMINNWSYYNATAETGMKPTFYVRG